MATPSAMPTTTESAKPIMVVKSVYSAFHTIAPKDPTSVAKTVLGAGSMNGGMESARQKSSQTRTVPTITTNGAASRVSRRWSISGRCEPDELAVGACDVPYVTYRHEHVGRIGFLHRLQSTHPRYP